MAILLYSSLGMCYCYLIFSLTFYHSFAKECRVLVLEGGGDRGAYQAGALNGMISLLPPDEVKYDVITGVSIGAINSAILGMHKKGDELLGSLDMLNHWRNITSANVYRNWPYLGPIYGLMYESGLFDTSYGFSYLNQTVSKYQGLQREIIIGTTEVKTGTYKTYQSGDFNKTEDFARALLSSAAVPMFFPLQTFRNTTYMDGGVKFNLDIFSGVHKCEDLGFKQKDVIIDVILCFNSSLAVSDPESLSPTGSLYRFLEITLYDRSMRMFQDTMQFMKDVTLRYIIAPTKTLPTSVVPLFFDPDQIEQMISYGNEDAREAIRRGVGYAQELIKRYSEDQNSYFIRRRRKTESNESNLRSKRQ